MTKLRRKLKDMAKKRAHKNTVQKRKLERALREQQAKKAAAENGEAPIELDEDDKQQDPVSDQKAANMLGGLVTAKIGANNNGKKKKPLSRKQLKRKAKLVEKGTAIAGALEKKWAVKKLRVKQRAQVRNENLDA